MSEELRLAPLVNPRSRAFARRQATIGGLEKILNPVFILA